MGDLTDVLVALSRIESWLRALDHTPKFYPPDGHFDAIVNQVTVLESTVRSWMDPRQTTERSERRATERRQGERRDEDRRQTAQNEGLIVRATREMRRANDAYREMHP